MDDGGRIFKISGKCERNAYWDGGTSGKSFSGKLVVDSDGTVKGVCDQLFGFLSSYDGVRYIYGKFVGNDSRARTTMLGLSNNQHDCSYIFIIPEVQNLKSGTWRMVSCSGTGMSTKISSLNLGRVEIEFEEEAFSEKAYNEIMQKYNNLDMKKKHIRDIIAHIDLDKICQKKA